MWRSFQNTFFSFWKPYVSSIISILWYCLQSVTCTAQHTPKRVSIPLLQPKKFKSQGGLSHQPLGPIIIFGPPFQNYQVNGPTTGPMMDPNPLPIFLQPGHMLSRSVSKISHHMKCVSKNIIVFGNESLTCSLTWACITRFCFDIRMW